MKSGSRISKDPIATTTPSPDRKRGREEAEDRRRERRRVYELLAPPDVPHRRDEARRWMEERTVLVMNGRVCERRPGERLHLPSESFAMWEAMRRGLLRQDPELHRAIERLTFEDVTRDHMGITMEVWRRRSILRNKRIARVRAEMLSAGVI